MSIGASDHQVHDMRSLYAHRLVAKKLRENPDLLEKVWANIAKARKSADLDAYQEWEVVLRSPIPRICDFIVRQSQVATRLRQSSPFTGFISKQEKEEINEQVKLRAFDSGGSEYNR